jgi:hypothetical protein
MSKFEIIKCGKFITDKPFMYDYSRIKNMIKLFGQFLMVFLQEKIRMRINSTSILRSANKTVQKCCIYKFCTFNSMALNLAVLASFSVLHEKNQNYVIW